MFTKKSPHNKTHHIQGAFYKVLKADDLLKSDSHQRYLKHLMEETGLQEAEFDVFYRVLIERFVELVQTLPRERGGEFSSFLNQSLMRAMYALQVGRDVLDFRDDQLKAYTAFSLGLLADVGLLASGMRIFLANEETKVISTWFPYQHSMLHVKGAHYYCVRHIDEARPKRMASYLTALYAYRIMPEEGLRCIAEDSMLFGLWLQSFECSSDEGGVGGAILNLAKERLAHYMGEEALLLPIEGDPYFSDETSWAEECLEWLKEGLEDGSITMNEEDSLVHLTSEGVLLDPEIFLRFAERYNRSQEWRVLRQQFNYLGIVPLSGQDYKFSQYFGKQPGVVSGRKSHLYSRFYRRNRIQNSKQSKQKINKSLLITDSSLLLSQNKRKQLSKKVQVTLSERSLDQVMASLAGKQNLSTKPSNNFTKK